MPMCMRKTEEECMCVCVFACVRERERNDVCPCLCVRKAEEAYVAYSNGGETI